VRQDIEQGRISYDAFLSHATEDKDVVARPLAEALTARRLRIWFDEFELMIGDSLVEKLSAGIRASRFGILVLSPAFFAKRWTKHELDMLEYLWITEGRILFPIWHNITEAEIRAYRPSIASIFALSTANIDISAIADEIAAAVVDH
jgi:hypothetical protein